MKRTLIKILAGFVLVLFPFLTPQLISFASEYGVETKHWSNARYDRTYLSPDPKIIKEAVVQVMAARTWGWRGSFAVHTWISVKAANAPGFTRYEVIGWRHTPLTIRFGVPDNYWAGNRPFLITDIRGQKAADIIGKLNNVVDRYPYKDSYKVWPGPNSNTFIAYISREIPELELDLPPTAIGKDYLAGDGVIGTPVSGRGVQFSAGGYGGFAFSPVEGLEFHLLGLTTGFDYGDMVLKLPGFGRVPLL
ncbi:DUF3750 domain-containing protein [Sneathiella sp.]|jgi:hypothetical protein|uniref:DUF3750 domain-containing protein n=1 Tax=Sneathiella sp. TaxID=1964365 RepID=UPI0039E2170F